MTIPSVIIVSMGSGILADLSKRWTENKHSYARGKWGRDNKKAYY